MSWGVEGRFERQLEPVRTVVGMAENARVFSTICLILLSKGAYFLADTYVSYEPTPDELAELAILAAGQVERFGITPKVALLSHSSFGSRKTPSSTKMRDAVDLIRSRAPDLQVAGEMHGDVALSEVYRNRTFPLANLAGQANILIMPNLDAANISYQLIKFMADALPVGPILVGAAKPAPILTPSVTARGIVNMPALSVVAAGSVHTARLIVARMLQPWSPGLSRPATARARVPASRSWPRSSRSDRQRSRASTCSRPCRPQCTCPCHRSGHVRSGR